MRYLLLIISSILLLLYSCRAPNYCFKTYSFDIPIKVNLKDTFHIGDTIWISLDMPNHVLDRTTGEYIDWTNFELFFEAGFSRLDTPTITNSDFDFDIVQNLGRTERLINGSVDIQINTKSIQNKKFKTGFIAKKTGLYNAGVFFPKKYLAEETYGEGKLNLNDYSCNENITSNSSITVNDGNINYHLIDGICQKSSDGLTICIQPYDKYVTVGGFAFVVAP